MPDGKTHHKIWKVGILGLPLYSAGATMLAVPLVHGDWLYFLAGLPAGYILGLFIDPDLDIVGMTQAEGRMLNTFPIIGNIMVGYWTVYGAFFRRHHRSWQTHGPMISTAIRYIYAFWWLVFLDRWWNIWATFFVIGMFFGTCYADILHWAADVITGEIGKRSRHG